MVSARKRKVVGVYLAAGSSKRMGTSKMSLELAEGVRLGGVALQQALSSELNSVVVVVREGESLDWLTASVPAHRLPDRCRIAVCPDAASGMAHSLRTGIQAAREMGAEGIMVLLADQPFIDGAVLRVLMNAFNENVGMIISPAEIEGSRSLRSLWDRACGRLQLRSKEMSGRDPCFARHCIVGVSLRPTNCNSWI